MSKENHLHLSRPALAWGSRGLKSQKPQFLPSEFHMTPVGSTCCLRQWYDWQGRGEVNDFRSTAGFLWAIRDTMRLRRGGLLWGGVPCCRCLVKTSKKHEIQWSNMVVLVCYKIHVGWEISTWFWLAKLDMGKLWYARTIHQHHGWSKTLACIYLIMPLIFLCVPSAWSHHRIMTVEVCMFFLRDPARNRFRSEWQLHLHKIYKVSNAGFSAGLQLCSNLVGYKMGGQSLVTCITVSWHMQHWQHIPSKVEQPSSSLLIYWPYIQFLVSRYAAAFQRLFLGLSSDTWICALGCVEIVVGLIKDAPIWVGCLHSTIGRPSLHMYLDRRLVPR